MKTLLLLALLIPLLSNSNVVIPINTENFEIPFSVWDELNVFLEEASLTLPPTPVLLYEAKSLYEFNLLTGKPYSIGGVYKDFLIILQPINILKSKGIYEKILLHELLHWVLYNLDEKFQEGVIYWWLGEYEKPEVEVFLDNFNGNLSNFIISHWEN
ncbi:hypothetical protein SAMN02745199_0563 [Thermosipho atlanticus DSM 15807]|uniref:Peptidase MA superfamily protein n=2 Tax=Thermosipho TaxID=2420 RepID=A0A1M5RR46_9BACT|nr:hypothetical protein SAMN02745199_0563 [Thermosipho atlanticus DSM 15807]